MFYEHITSSQSLPVNEFVVRRIPLSAGDDGVRQTVNEMRSMVQESAHNPYIKELAVCFTRGIRPGDWNSLAGGLLQRVRSAFRYVPDARGVEEIWKPEIHAMRFRQNGQTWGDCDDGTVWILALARTLSFDCRITCTATGNRGLAYNHVFGELLIPSSGEWMNVDFCAPNERRLRAMSVKI